MRLEQKLYECGEELEQKQQIYFVAGDLNGLSAIALYGDMDRGYDLKSLCLQLHIHEDSKLGFSKCYLKGYDQNELRKLNVCEALLAEVDAIALGFPKISIGNSPPPSNISYGHSPPPLLSSNIWCDPRINIGSRS